MRAAAASAALLIFHLLLPAPAALSGGGSSGPLNDDVLGLIVFKSGLDDPTSALSSWTENDDTPCSWSHVQCDPSTSRVIRLLLSSLSLSSPRLPRGLDRLSSLQSISLSGNTISGDLPRSLSLLSSLSLLDLSSNSLSGRIPSDLPSLLRSLDLSSNSLSGPLPPIPCSSLRFLDLSGNLLEGPLPPAISSCSFLLHLNLSSNSLSGDIAPLLPLSRLRVLDLSHNSFTGAVPESLAFLHNLKILHLNSNRFSGAVPVGFSAHLTRLDLSHNSFHGPIPASIQSLVSLSFISFSQNQLSGDIPHWIGNNITALQHLDLSQNQLTGNIPDSLSSLTDLRYLSLSDNMLTGEIPASLSQCWTLNELHVNRNQLNGTIPEAIFELGLAAIDLSSNSLSGGMPAGSSKLAETLTSLDLSDNRLTGVIPPELALYFKLQYLNLSWNHLHTRIPPEIGYFRNLTVLDLRNASLYGEIPPDLCDCGSLAVLQLDENLLSGEIPEEIGNCSSLYLLSLSFNGLVGRIPTAMSELKRLKILKLEMNALSGEIPQQLGGLDSLLAVNISHNRLVGRLPIGGVFPSLDQSALQGNLGLCTPLVAEPCKMNVPKPLVLDPNAYGRGMGSNNVSSSSDSLMTTPRSRNRRFLSVSAVVAMSAALVIILGVAVVSLLNFSARRRVWVVEKKNPVPDSSIKSSPRPMSPAAAAGKMVLFGPERTEDFVGSGAESLLSRAVEIGKGAFGTVYRASIGEGRDIAIKRLITSNIVEQQDIFDGELRALGMAKHPNLMPLKGYFWTPELQLLISDYAPDGSLQDRLAAAPPMTWAERYKIVLGTARGLAYLHHSIRPPIIHYSMKPSNVLLDERCNPMVSDFGLSRLLPKLDEHVISSRFQAGTMGYVAPELACRSLRINEKCDVYGFGVVVLEVVTGRRAVEYGDDDVVVLMDQVRGMMEQGRGGECVDQGMGEFPEEEVLPVLKLGMVCTSQIPSSRPSMAEVVQILELIKSPVVDSRIGGYNY